MSKTMHVVSVSSGKDSTALLDLAMRRCPIGSVVPIFCDTENEDQAVYDHLVYLENRFGVPIVRLKADFADRFAVRRMFIARDQRTRRDKAGRKVRWSNKAKRRALAVLHPSGNAFLDLCKIKGRFPSRKAQFCTQELKRNMAVEYQLGLIEQGRQVISWQGVRRDESDNRRHAKRIERIAPRLYAFRPIVDWTAQDVVAHCVASNVALNPLYKQGQDRVGCMPCINCNKDGLRAIAARFPQHIARISEWERVVGQCSKRGFSTFFSDSPSAQDRRQIFADLNIHTRVEWAKTTRGGKQFDLLAASEDNTACASSLGLCDQG